jgi:hypothetical protein
MKTIKYDIIRYNNKQERNTMGEVRITKFENKEQWNIVVKSDNGEIAEGLAVDMKDITDVVDRLVRVVSKC